MGALALRERPELNKRGGATKKDIAAQKGWRVSHFVSGGGEGGRPGSTNA
ncbi:hypothetical protein Y88_0325 [Novosphingobium nitrogenifigens DSM 19370]|uniref:Uncharacterized protein n=1 Tax=Novosphingobium nitrogenifigens DSM 19370 TaxID=983920 RepID=F1ZAU9_9SPHN|nr:hypothetical protein Y88_0325 [Novosphingobium nitrogenifigens DSM 19370]